MHLLQLSLKHVCPGLLLLQETFCILSLVEGRRHVRFVILNFLLKLLLLLLQMEKPPAHFTLSLLNLTYQYRERIRPGGEALHVNRLARFVIRLVVDRRGRGLTPGLLEGALLR